VYRDRWRPVAWWNRCRLLDTEGYSLSTPVPLLPPVSHADAVLGIGARLVGFLLPEYFPVAGTNLEFVHRVPGVGAARGGAVPPGCTTLGLLGQRRGTGRFVSCRVDARSPAVGSQAPALSGSVDRAGPPKPCGALLLWSAPGGPTVPALVFTED